MSSQSSDAETEIMAEPAAVASDDAPDATAEAAATPPPPLDEAPPEDAAAASRSVDRSSSPTAAAAPAANRSVDRSSSPTAAVAAVEAVDWSFPGVAAALDAATAEVKRRLDEEAARIRESLSAAAERAAEAERKYSRGREDALKEEIVALRAEVEAQAAQTQRKQQIICNLVEEVQRQKEKTTMARAMAAWRGAEEAKKREAFCSKIAARHNRLRLQRRAVVAWKTLLETTWSERVHRSARVKAEEACVRLAAECEERTKALTQELTAVREEMQRSEERQLLEKENLRAAVMRGVCALNMETMGALQEGPELSPKHSELDSMLAVTRELEAVGEEEAGSRQVHGVVARQRVTTGPVLRKAAGSGHTDPPARSRTRHPLIAGQEEVADQRPHRASSRSPVAPILVERHHPVNKRTAAPLLAASHDADRRLRPI